MFSSAWRKGGFGQPDFEDVFVHGVERLLGFELHLLRHFVALQFGHRRFRFGCPDLVHALAPVEQGN